MKTKENTLSSVTLGMENILETAGIVTNSQILLLAALVPSMIKASLLKCLRVKSLYA